MPATITHAFFAKDVYDILPTEIRDKSNLDRCKMFGQSMDSLMFYNLFSILPGKKIRKFNKEFHTSHSRDFFIHLLHFMRDHSVEDEDTTSFLIGTICHYVLDSTVHPYVVYKTGNFEKRRKETYKYNNVHAFMEAFIDNDMVRRRENTNPYFFDLGKYCFDLREFSPTLKQTIQYSFYNTFQRSQMDQIYYKSLKQMKRALMHYRRDPYGIKKFFYKLADSFTPRGCYRFEAISYHYPLEDKHHFLNSEHKTWRNPTTYDMTSDESFVDLYLKSIKKAKILICASMDYIHGKDIDLEQVFPDVSYLTGIDWKEKKELKYFEF